jgi:hypothetical protein
LTQPAAHPHHVSKLLEPALTTIVGALADRGDPSGPAFDTRAIEAWTVIQSLQPRDAIDLMLSGQLLALHEMFADGTRDVLRGMADTMKQRSQTTLVAMARVAQGHIDRLEKRGMQPYRTEVPAAQPRQQPAEAPAAEPAPPEAASPEQRPAAAEENPAATPEPVAIAAAATTGEPSWLDAPYQEWVLDTPAALLAEAKQEAAARRPVEPATRDTQRQEADALPYLNRSRGRTPEPALVNAGD